VKPAKPPRELARGEGVSFWLIGTEVYRAPTGAAFDTFGIPQGVRWECEFSLWNRFRALFDFAKEVTP